MSSFTRKSLVVVVLLVVTAICKFQLQAMLAKASVDTVDLTDIPYQVAGWSGKDFPVAEDVYEILETEDVLVREYQDAEGYPVVLAIVFADRIRGSFHPPEICYIGAGAELIGKEREQMSLSDGTLLDTNKLVVKSSEEDSLTAWYWFMAGDKSVASFYQQQLFMIKDSLAQKPLQGALIRVSVPENSELGKKKANQFIQDFNDLLADLY